MKKAETGPPLFIVRCTTDGAILETLFTSASTNPDLISGNLYELISDTESPALSYFFTTLASQGMAQQNTELCEDLNGLQAAFYGQLQGNSAIVTCLPGTVSYAAPATDLPAADLHKKITKLQSENRLLKKKLSASSSGLDEARHAICVLNSEGIIQEVSKSIFVNLGYEPDETVGKKITEIIFEADRQAVWQAFTAATRSGQPSEAKCRTQTHSGQLVEMLWTFKKSAGNPNLVYATAHDIIAYTRLEQKLIEHKKQLKEAQRLARIGTLEVDMDNETVKVSEILGEILSLDHKQEYVIDDFKKWVHPGDLERLLKNVYSAPAQVSTIQNNYRYFSPKGNCIHLASHAVLERDQNGRVIKVFSKVQDVTERYLVEAALRQEQEQTRLIIETALNAYIGLNEEGIIVDCNSAALKLLCLQRADVLGKQASEIVKTPHGNPVFDNELFTLHKVCDQRSIRNALFEREILNNRNQQIKAEISATCFKVDGRPYLNAFIRDVTDKALADQLLRQSERRFRSLIQTGSDLIALLTPDGEYKYVSLNVEKVLQYRPGDLIGRNALSFIHPDEVEEAIAALEKVSHLEPEGKVTLPAFRFRNGNGEYRWVETIITNLLNDPAIEALVANSRDITTRKKAEEEKDRLTAIIEATTDCIGIIDTKGNVLHLNSAFNKLLGASFDNPKYHHIKGYHPDWALTLVQEIGLPEAEKLGTWTGETAMITKDGEELPFSQLIISHKNNKGEVEYFSTIARDISKTKQMEFALKESKERYKSLFDHNPDGVFALNWNGNVISVNNSLREMLGIAENDVTEEHFSKFVAEADAGLAEKYFDISKKAITATFELLMVARSGQQITAQITTTPIMIEGELVGVYGIAKDITEKKQLDETLRKTNEQLRALTAHIHLVREEERRFIAREIHDELGQQLTALKIDISLLANKIATIRDPKLSQELSKEVDSMLSISDETIRCIRELVKTIRPIAIDDLGLVSEIKSRLEKFGKMAGLQTHFETDLDELDLDPENLLDIYRIFQESLTNVARHAKASKVFVKLSKSGPDYCLEITDNGTGIPPEKLQGTNSFGLLGMRERAISLKGSLDFRARAEGGTTVVLKIPRRNAVRKILKKSDTNI